MSITRKMHAHGELLWWLVLLIVATALTCVLAREAHGVRGARCSTHCTQDGGSVTLVMAWSDELGVANLTEVIRAGERRHVLGGVQLEKRSPLTVVLNRNRTLNPHPAGTW